ncbi:M23 family metallopeptidase [Leptospira noguchii]|uniref:M23 family metallopeptidase n=1 Tax=Leptospira noguchii TaxID=28182 RepID=UPI0002BE7F78|nr:M23 family metallopeptidase [Leptospira noguchii]EMI71079.1 peptidase, M23 family [Leptospira noguchii str. Bonito]EMS87362.1 peptidase, M23 family [Leptospira noguchii str. Cascata]
MNIIFKLLNVVPYSIQRKVLNFSEIKKSQNYWNHSFSAVLQTQTIPDQSVLKKIDSTDKKEKILFFSPLRNPKITSRFGWRNLNINGKASKQFHLGIDLVSENRDVFAPEDCVIRSVLNRDEKHPVRFKYENGTWIDLLGNRKIPKGRAWTPYVIAVGVYSKNLYKFKHIDPCVAVGENLQAGDKVGTYDNLGYSMGAHLHFEVWLWDTKLQDWKKAPIDPEKFLKEKKVL